MRPAFGLAFLAFAGLFLGLLFWPGIACGGCGHYASVATACLVNVKAQALGLAMYAGDHDDRYLERHVWMDGVRPYVKNDGAFRAPEFAKTAPAAYGYAFDSRLSLAREPTHPERVPLVYESTSLGRNASDPVTSLPHPGRHGGKNNVAYADGHAGRVVP